MTSFNEWLEQRDERIYNELMEPPVAGADQKTLMDKWTYKNRGGVTRMVKDLVKTSTFRDFSKGRNTYYLELDTDGYEFLKEKLFSIFEKADKLGRAVGQHFRNIDSNYEGKLIVKLPSNFINEQNFYKAIYKLASDNNLVVRKSKNYFTILSKKGISQEDSHRFIDGYVWFIYGSLLDRWVIILFLYKNIKPPAEMPVVLFYTFIDIVLIYMST